MKSGIPWNLRGVDEETREAVIEAARRSGMSVGQWLNHVLADDGVEHGEPEDTPGIPPADQTQEAAELAETIERLTKRLGSLDDRARASIPGLKDRLDEIERHVGDLSDTSRTVNEQAQSLRGVQAVVAALSREVDNADERARSLIEGRRAAPRATPQAPTIDLDRVNQAIAELDQRIAVMGQRLAAPPPPPLETHPLKLDEIKARLDALLAQTPAKAAPQPQQTVVIDAALRALETRIDTAKAQLEARLAAREAQAQTQSTTTDQIGRIEQRLADIGTRLADAEVERQKPKKEIALASAIREISAHQRSIDDRAETIAMRRDQKALSAAMAALRTDIGALAEQVNAISRIGDEQHGAFYELAQRIDALAADKPVDRSLLSAIQADLETMRGMAESQARQDTLGNIEQRHEGLAAQLNQLLHTVPDRAKLDELSDEVSALRRSLESDDSPRAIARLEMRMSELGRAIEATLSSRNIPPQADPAVERLEGQLRDLSKRIETIIDPSVQTAAIATAEQRLQGRMDEIANRLGGLFVTAARPHAAAIETAHRELEGRLEEISSRLGGLMDTGPQAAAMESVQHHLEERIEDVTARLTTLMDARLDSRPQTEAIQNAQRQLEGRLEDIVNRLAGMFDTRTQDAALEHVHERLQAITDRIDTLSASQREPSAALDAIKSEIGSLRFEIAVKETLQPPSTDHLETQIRDLAKQLETVAGGTQEEGKALADLEAQVARLASELEQSKPQAQELKQIEERLERLQALLADTTRESIVGARTEARKAVDDLAKMVAGNEIDAGLVRGLMRDLDSLRNAAGTTDDTTRTKLESIGQTMAQVVDRLSRLERETAVASERATAASAAARAAATQAAAATETVVYAVPPAVAKLEPASLLWKSGFRTGATPVSERGAEAPAPEAEKKPLDRRADFIAAARRAAQAAAAEAASIESTANTPEVAPAERDTDENLPAAERKPGAFARISQAIRNRKKPLLLAAAAIVLAIGAMQVYGKVTAVVSSRNLIAATDVATWDKSLPIARNVTAANTAPTVPSVAAPALISPPATPDTSLAFAAADGVTSTFGSTAVAPPENTLTPPATPDVVATTDQSTDDQPTDDITTASTSAAPTTTPPAPAISEADTNNPVVLASAEAPPAAPSASGLDQRLGSPKLLAAADQNDPAADFEIATRYAEGSLVPKNLAEAAKWYTKAAEGGVAVAQYRLGSLYERGQGVAKDLTSAVNWYQRAADQGNVNAMHNLAVLMSEGADSSPDHDKALQWFLAAGNYGVRDSQYNLGVIYARGLGTAQDLVESYKWFAIAAAQGDTDASARRDEVAKAMTGDDLAKARVAVSGWHVKSPIAEANSVAAPDGGWDSPTNTLGEQDRQALVKKIQTLLADAGYDPGPADGVAGPKTVDAVRAYQRKVGVPDTGALDKNLVASLSDGQ